MDKEILQRYVEGNVSPEEIIAVVDWLDADESHVREFMALHKLNDISLLNQPDSKVDVQKKKKTITFRQIGYELAKIAAILILFWEEQNYMKQLQQKKMLSLIKHYTYLPDNVPN